MSDKELVEKLLEENEKLRRENAALADSVQELQAKLERANREYDRLLKRAEQKNHVIKVANHNRFYATKEPSFEDSPVNEPEVNLERAGKGGRKAGSRNYDGIDFEALATETVTNDIAERMIEDGLEPVRIGEDVSYLIDVRKDVRVIKVVTPKYVDRGSGSGKIYQAASDKAFPHSVATPSLVADVINAKYNLDVPIYRYSKYLSGRGLPLSDMDLTNFVKRGAERLSPLYEAIRSRVVNQTNSVLHSDETPIEVLDYLKGENRKNGYVFAYVSSFYDNPIYLYDFNKTRKTGKTAALLDGFRGYVVCDGYAGYDELARKGIKLQRCFAHIRRKFYDIAKTLPESLRKASAASEMVRRIDRLFYLEGQFQCKKLTPAQILEERHGEAYLAEVEGIYDFLDSINPESGTPLEAAVRYFRDVEAESRTFLEDGHVPISNNLAERAIKPFAIMRRNCLFAKTERGAEISGRLFTIVQTARANGIIVESYLEYALQNIETMPIEDLLPWSENISNLFGFVRKKPV